MENTRAYRVVFNEKDQAYDIYVKEKGVKMLVATGMIGNNSNVYTNPQTGISMDLSGSIIYIGEEDSTKDAINPDHYKQGSVECISALEAATVNKTGIEAVCTANVIKYLWRYEAKNGLEDVKKAKQYLLWLEEHLSKKGGQQ